MQRYGVLLESPHFVGMKNLWGLVIFTKLISWEMVIFAKLISWEMKKKVSLPCQNLPQNEKTPCYLQFDMCDRLVFRL